MLARTMGALWTGCPQGSSQVWAWRGYCDVPRQPHFKTKRQPLSLVVAVGEGFEPPRPSLPARLSDGCLKPLSQPTREGCISATVSRVESFSMTWKSLYSAITVV